MKVKRILRFYYSADSLERAFDNLIKRQALASYAGDCGKGAERLLDIIEEKRELSRLWSYMNAIIPALDDRERRALKEYAAMRCGLKNIEEDKRKLLRRSVMKFTRRARRLESFEKGIRLVSKYYCLIAPSL